MPNPKLTERSPRLTSGLNPFISRIKCQRCGHTGPEVRGWIEHDHHDQPEYLYVFLCKKCSNVLIDPHPRLYSQVMPNAPLPGIMDICADCRHRLRSQCISKLAKFNGGPGLKIDIVAPATAHITCSPRRNSGWIKIYTHPATGCSGKETRPNEPTQPAAAAQPGTDAGPR